MANWTAFLPEAQKWVSDRYSVLHGHPNKKAKKPKKIRLAKAHVHNALVAHGVHPKASGGKRVSLRSMPIRRTQAYRQK